MLRFFFSSCLYLLPLTTFSSSLHNYIYPKQQPSYSNYGTTGLIQMPSARFHEAGSLGLSWSSNDPYLRGSLIAYPFSWFEAAYGYTDINNALYSNVASFSGSQSYKDKGFDVKIKLLNESQYLPSIAMGVRDLAGSGTFEGEYLALSKFYKNMDFTIGVGWGDLSHGGYRNPLTKISDQFQKRTFVEGGQGGEFSAQRYFSGRMGIFGGVEVFIPNTKGLRFKIEYDSTTYLDEAFGRGRESSPFAFEPVKDTESRINFGLVYPISNNFQVKASFVKGNTYNIGFSYVLSLGKKNKKIKRTDPHVPVKSKEIIKKVNASNDLYFYRNVKTSLEDREIFLQKASLDGEIFSLAYSQMIHASHSRAVGRVARVLDEISPDNVKTFNIVNVNAGMGLSSVTIDRELFSKYSEGNVHNLAFKGIDIHGTKYKTKKYKYNPINPYPINFLRVEPALRSQIGGPDGFFFGDLRLSFNAETLFSRSLTLITQVSYGLYDNMGSLQLASNSIIPHVRTDVVKYLNAGRNEFNLDRVQLNFFQNPTKNLYYKISGGILEQMFSGVGGEVLYKPFNKNYAIGADAFSVQQRGYDGLLTLLDYKATTGHINFYYREPRSKILFVLKGGKYLAGDSGVTFDFSRRFKSGLVTGIFFSRTDISKREFGEGSFDKGFYFSIPIDVFTSKYNKRFFSWGLKPLTRDGAAILNHGFHLYGVTEQAQYETYFRDRDDIYD
ncbi:YjbH domain-containing protein [Gammaproteobacteria bacterium]|nr:YjbH domain-containing protein [Gammaproteobacteria bacterium]